MPTERVGLTHVGVFRRRGVVANVGRQGLREEGAGQDEENRADTHKRGLVEYVHLVRTTVMR